MILADCHTHTSFSSDSDSPLDAQIQAAIAAGLNTITITDHHDLDFPVPGLFQLEPESYLRALQDAKARYDGQIRVLAGIELGLQKAAATSIQKFWEKQLPFDFVIGSTHLVDGEDPYDASYWKKRSPKQAYLRYYETLYENVCQFDGYDVCGHLDYICRYGRREGAPYDIGDYWDIIEAILRKLIDKGIGLEVNTAGMKDGFPFPNPEPEILLRYREMDGELITIGSDGHDPTRIGADFSKLSEMLARCGFHYYAVFENRKPRLYPI